MFTILAEVNYKTNWETFIRRITPVCLALRNKNISLSKLERQNSLASQGYVFNLGC